MCQNIKEFFNSYYYALKEKKKIIYVYPHTKYFSLHIYQYLIVLFWPQIEVPVTQLSNGL